MFDEGKEEGGVEDQTEDEEAQEEGEEEEGKEFAEEPPDEDDRNCPPHEFECWTEDCIALRYFLFYILHKILNKKGDRLRKKLSMRFFKNWGEGAQIQAQFKILVSM